MEITTYQTTPEKHGKGTYFFTDCMWKGIQRTLYIRGSKEANKYWDKKLGVN